MLQTLRTAASIAPGGVKDDLMLVVAELSHAIDKFSAQPTADALRDMTKHWAHGVNLMDKAKQLRKETLACLTSANAASVPPMIS